jgi:hypothetical protein
LQHGFFCQRCPADILPAAAGDKGEQMRQKISNEGNQEVKQREEKMSEKFELVLVHFDGEENVTPRLYRPNVLDSVREATGPLLRRFYGPSEDATEICMR